MNKILDSNISNPALLRVLVVEDEIIIATSLVDVLNELGCAICGPVLDLGTGLEKARTEPLDAAILNLIIQGETAYGIADILRSRNIPFAFASGMAGDLLEPEWQDSPYIAKPYSFDEVRAVLQSLAPHYNWPAT